MLRLEHILDASAFSQGFLLHSKLGTETVPSSSGSSSGSSNSNSSGLRCVPFRPKWFTDAVLAEAKK